MKKFAGTIIAMVIAISVTDPPVYRASNPAQPHKIIQKNSRPEKPDMILLPAVQVWFT